MVASHSEGWSWQLRWVLLAAVAVSVIVTTSQLSLFFAGEAAAPEARVVEAELLRLERRRRAIDADLLALSVALARANETWREQAVRSIVESRRAAKAKGSVEAPQGSPPPTAPLQPGKGPWGGGAGPPPWGAGPPPDAYFLDRPRCAPPSFPASFHVYARADGEACARAALGWRLEPQCPGADGRARENARLRRQVLITGVQRSGTHFTWELLNRLGIHVHHEGLGPAGSVSWLYSWREATFAINNPTPLSPDHRFCVVLHQVRHPLRVLASVVKATKPRDRYWQWIYGQEPQSIDPRASALRRAAQLWLAQNLRIERFADARFRTEETSPRDVCRAAGFDEVLCASDGRYHTTSSKVIQPIIEPKKVIDLQDPNYRPPSVTWADLEREDMKLAQQVKDLAEAYGYNLDPRYHPQSLATTEFKA